MTTTLRIALAVTAALSVSAVAGAGASDVFALSAQEMDSVTAGGLTLGSATTAASQAAANATGAHVITATQTVVLTSKSDPAGLPPVLSTYATVSYGLAMAAHGGNPGTPASMDTSVSTASSLPYVNAIGKTAIGSYVGANGVIESTASVYIGGAWISLAPAWVRQGP
jgi:hypothetical protein